MFLQHQDQCMALRSFHSYNAMQKLFYLNTLPFFRMRIIMFKMVLKNEA